MTPAETITAAVTRLRARAANSKRRAALPGPVTANPSAAPHVLARDPLAAWLESAAKLHEPNVCNRHEGCAPLGCQWCADEDWPCADIRNALAVARVVLGTPEQQP